MKWMTLAVLSCVTALSACQSSSTSTANAPQFLTQKIYHGPAQSYDFDLGSTVLRGELKLKQFCNTQGSSLDILDQLNQQVRLDTFNLNHHPTLHTTIDSTLDDITPRLVELYQEKYQATAGEIKSVKNHLGEFRTVRLDRKDHKLDLAILTRYGYAYILQLNSPLAQNDSELGQKQLLTLLKSLQIPGIKLKGSSAETPIIFDLSIQDPKAHSAWQKTYCS